MWSAICGEFRNPSPFHHNACSAMCEMEAMRRELHGLANLKDCFELEVSGLSPPRFTAGSKTVPNGVDLFSVQVTMLESLVGIII